MGSPYADEIEYWLAHAQAEEAEILKYYCLESIQGITKPSMKVKLVVKQTSLCKAKGPIPCDATISALTFLNARPGFRLPDGVSPSSEGRNPGQSDKCGSFFYCLCLIDLQTSRASPPPPPTPHPPLLTAAMGALNGACSGAVLGALCSSWLALEGD